MALPRALVRRQPVAERQWTQHGVSRLGFVCPFTGSSTMCRVGITAELSAEESYGRADLGRWCARWSGLRPANPSGQPERNDPLEPGDPHPKYGLTVSGCGLFVGRGFPVLPDGLRPAVVSRDGWARGRAGRDRPQRGQRAPGRPADRHRRAALKPGRKVSSDLAER